MSKFTPEEFVAVWMDRHNDASLNDIGEALGVSRQYVEQYAGGLRKKGVNLPKLSRGSRRQRAITQELVEELNAQIKLTTPKPNKEKKENE